MSISFKQILVPYDGSKTGDKAFNGALQIAKKFESKITLLSCIERDPTFVFFETNSDRENINKRKEMMQKKIDVLKAISIQNNIKFNSKISICSIASKCIVSYVKSHKIDLIVMSKSFKINPEKIYHESTVNYVYGHVNCPMFNI